MNQPNLFDFATSELSQDAFICWLLSWAKPEYEDADPMLRQCALEFLQAFFKMKGQTFPAKIDSVRVLKQDANIDVLCIVNDRYPIIIEDKTHTSQHSGQLEKYFEDVLNRGFVADNVIPIYFKTGDQSDLREVSEAGYFPFLRADVLEILNKYDSIENDIFRDYHNRLSRIEASVQSYKTLPLGQWHWDSWKGFYSDLQKFIPKSGWGYVPNQTGGFMGFWFGWHHNAYLQLEATGEFSQLCVKIHVEERDRQAAARWAWHCAVVAAGKEADLPFKKPPRFGKGQTMTVCVLNQECRQVRNGLLDMEQTAAYINRIIQCLQSVSHES